MADPVDSVDVLVAPAEEVEDYTPPTVDTTENLPPQCSF